MNESTHSARQSQPLSSVKDLRIEMVEISVLDIVPKIQRRIPTGKIPYGESGSWIGRPIFVRISAGGLEGHGEIRPINPFVGEIAATMYPTLRDFYAPRLIGRSALNIEALLDDCEKTLPGNPAARAAIDIALHDLVGKALGVPVHTLLGGACRDEIQLEWSIGLSDESEMAAEAVTAVERFGVQCVCVKVGPSGREDADVRTLTEVRSVVGPSVVLGMDANTTYNANGAVRLARRLTDARIGYFEQPVARGALKEMRRIRDAVDCAILADESLFTRDDAIRIIEAGAADVLGLKFYKCGGLHRMREIAAIAAAADLSVNCAGTTAGTYIEAIAAAHLTAAVPNHAFGAEFIFGLPSVGGHDPVAANCPIDVVNGRCPVPKGPGLGIEIDRKAVEKLTLARATITGSKTVETR